VASIGEKDVIKVYCENTSGTHSFLDQSSEFQSTEDTPCCLNFSPDAKYLAVGFDSGWIRVFDVNNTSVFKSVKTSDTEISLLM